MSMSTKFIVLKTSVSRKPFHELSKRQKQNIIREIRDNMKKVTSRTHIKTEPVIGTTLNTITVPAPSQEHSYCDQTVYNDVLSNVAEDETIEYLDEEYINREQDEVANMEVVENVEEPNTRAIQEQLNRLEAGQQRICEQIKEIQNGQKALHEKLDILINFEKNKVLGEFSITQKPKLLPLGSLDELAEFDKTNREEYGNTVQYLQFIGGFNLKETISLCFKECITNEVSADLTWHGGKTKKALSNCKITSAIFDAVRRNKHITEKPSKREFSVCMQAALRAAQERLRIKNRRLNGDIKRVKDPWAEVAN